jgi:hypothetical protein
VIARRISEEIRDRLQGYAKGFTRTVPATRHTSNDQRHVNDIYRGPCGKCNSGWMSGLEEQVEEFLVPLAFSDVVLMSPERLRRLALWSCKTAATATYRYLPTHADELLTVEARRDLVQGMIPADWRIRFGRAPAPVNFSGGQPSASAFHVEAHCVTLTDDRTNDYRCRMFTTTFQLVHLVVQVLGHNASESPFIEAVPPRFPRLWSYPATPQSLRWPIEPMNASELGAVMHLLPPEGTPSDRGVAI